MRKRRSTLELLKAAMITVEQLEVRLLKENGWKAAQSVAGEQYWVDLQDNVDPAITTNGTAFPHEWAVKILLERLEGGRVVASKKKRAVTKRVARKKAITRRKKRRSRA